MEFRGQYIYPPRPETAVTFGSPTYRQFQNNKSFIAQLKLNGQRNLIYFHPNGDIILWNRHKQHHRNYEPRQWLIDEIRSTIKVKPGTWNVIDSELLHAKGPTIKDTIYLFDTLVLDDDWMIGSTYRDRYDKLLNLVNGSLAAPTQFGLSLSEHIWMATNIAPPDWDGKWEAIAKQPMIEGFVLKNLSGKLLPGFNQHNNSGWQTRVRKPNNVVRH